MSTPCDQTSTRRWSTVAAILAAALCVLLPTLDGSSTPGTSVAVASLALALAALLVLAAGLIMLGARSVSGAVAAGEDPPPVLTGRATDPVHHPVRPRAPGLA